MKDAQYMYQCVNHVCLVNVFHLELYSESAPRCPPSSCWKQHSWPLLARGAAPNWGRGPWQTATGPEKAVPSNKGGQLHEHWLCEPEK